MMPDSTTPDIRQADSIVLEGELCYKDSGWGDEESVDWLEIDGADIMDIVTERWSTLCRPGSSDREYSYGRVRITMERLS